MHQHRRHLLHHVLFDRDYNGCRIVRVRRRHEQRDVGADVRALVQLASDSPFVVVLRRGDALLLGRPVLHVVRSNRPPVRGRHRHVRVARQRGREPLLGQQPSELELLLHGGEPHAHAHADPIVHRDRDWIASVQRLPTRGLRVHSHDGGDHRGCERRRRSHDERGAVVSGNHDRSLGGVRAALQRDLLLPTGIHVRRHDRELMQGGFLQPGRELLVQFLRAGYGPDEHGLLHATAVRNGDAAGGLLRWPVYVWNFHNPKHPAQHPHAIHAVERVLSAVALRLHYFWVAGRRLHREVRWDVRRRPLGAHAGNNNQRERRGVVLHQRRVELALVRVADLSVHERVVSDLRAVRDDPARGRLHRGSRDSNL